MTLAESQWFGPATTWLKGLYNMRIVTDAASAVLTPADQLGHSRGGNTNGGIGAIEAW